MLQGQTHKIKLLRCVLAICKYYMLPFAHDSSFFCRDCLEAMSKALAVIKSNATD